MMEPTASRVRGLRGSCRRDVPRLSNARWLSPNLRAGPWQQSKFHTRVHQEYSHADMHWGSTKPVNILQQLAWMLSKGQFGATTVVFPPPGIGYPASCNMAPTAWPPNVANSGCCSAACTHLRKVMPSVVRMSGLSGLFSSASMYVLRAASRSPCSMYTLPICTPQVQHAGCRNIHTCQQASSQGPHVSMSVVECHCSGHGQTHALDDTGCSPCSDNYNSDTLSQQQTLAAPIPDLHVGGVMGLDGVGLLEGLQGPVTHKHTMM